MKNYTLWLKIGASFQILTGLVHATSFLVPHPPKNDTEKQLQDLMGSYKMDLGAGFHPSMLDLLNDLSAHLTLAYLLGGLINWLLLRKKVGPDLWRGILHINLLIFGISFGLTLYLTFLPPILFTGLTFLFLVIARISLPKTKINS